jgi:UDP-N-acetylglucosamine--N-acetylmuramyl-(pentapeptide) pyrophosphoryl-undecaprenol N-acetylglucosamine transferase
VRTGGRDRIVIAGGGTGGHVFPGLAVADAVRALADVDVVFAGTKNGLEARVVPERGYALELFDVAPMKGGGARRAIRGGLIAGLATLRALGTLRRLAPRAVVSIGGYAAGPASLAALLLRVPVVIVEPNSIVGFANRVLAPFARRAYVAWDETARSVGARRARVFGAPIRAGFGPVTYEATASRRVLVLGGSQGAAALNERVPAALALVAAKVQGLEVVHQSGPSREAAVTTAYARAGFPRAAVNVTPFLADVPGEMGRADLIVARSGASTVAEIAAVGRASILVPFPQAADDHQTKNARALERAGGAVCLPQMSADEVGIAREVERLLGDAVARTRMANAARASGKPDAAARIAEDLLGLLRIAETRGRSQQMNGHGRHAEAI